MALVGERSISKAMPAFVSGRPLGFKRGMTGGELIVRGSAGTEAGAGMRRGLLVIAKNAGDRAGLGMIAGSVVVFGSAGRDTGLWSKRGSVVALGPITPPPTYTYACHLPVHRPASHAHALTDQIWAFHSAEIFHRLLPALQRGHGRTR